MPATPRVWIFILASLALHAALLEILPGRARVRFPREINIEIISDGSRNGMRKEESRPLIGKHVVPIFSHEPDVGSAKVAAVSSNRLGLRPEYPRLSRLLGENGTVIVLVGFDDSGKVHQRKIFSSSGFPRLDRAALASLEGWSAPIGTSFSDGVKIVFRFQLTN